MIQAVAQINTVNETITTTKHEMTAVAPHLDMHGIGRTLAPQLIAEIGDVRHFEEKSSLVCFADVEPQENSSGNFVQKYRSMSRQLHQGTIASPQTSIPFELIWEPFSRF